MQFLTDYGTGGKDKGVCRQQSVFDNLEHKGEKYLLEDTDPQLHVYIGKFAEIVRLLMI